MLLLIVCALVMRHTFGAFPLSTVPAPLILLISGLVSWRIWEKKYDQDIYNHSLEVLKMIFLVITFFFLLEWNTTVTFLLKMFNLHLKRDSLFKDRVFLLTLSFITVLRCLYY